MTPGESEPAPVKRRLTAILAADAVGYSARMAEDEERTLRTLAGHRNVIGGLIASHDGRIVGTAGDSVLAEFPSSVSAVRCAVEIQEALATRNDSLPAVERLQFRIGVNLGDVIVEGNDILGDGVNVASRLEGIAEPGGICIASSVFDQISGKLNLGFDDMGERALKNISRPVRVYRVGGAASVPRPAVKAVPAPKPSRTGWIVAGGVTVIALAVVAFNISQRRDDAPPPQQIVASTPPVDEATRLKLQIAQAERATAEAELARVRALNEKPAAPAAAARSVSPPSPQAPPGEPAAAVQTGTVAQTQTGVAAPQSAGRAAIGRGFADVKCEADGNEPAQTVRAPVTVNAGALTMSIGAPGRAGYTTLHGTPGPDGALILNGTFIGRGPRGRAARGNAHYEGRLVNGRGTLTGNHGVRSCTIQMTLR